MSNNPYQAPMGYDPGGPSGGGSSQAALAKVKPPAIALLIVGALNIIGSLYGIGNSALFLAGMHPAAAQQAKQFEELRQQGGDAAEFAGMMEQISSSFQGPVGLGLNVLALIVAVVIILGALKMMKLESYGFAKTAAILVMIPCLSNCCVVGIPIGIWGLIILSSVDVKNSFR